MAITPRTLFNSPTPAIVAAVSLLSFSALGTVAYKMTSNCHVKKAERTVVLETDPCDGVRTTLGESRSDWSEFDWYTLASCYEQANNSRKVIDVSSQGLRFYPRSESLFNMKGYHQIALREFDDAVATLSLGMNRVGTPTSGTMANNLAWAGLWVPREMELDRSRSLYKQALRYDSKVCAVIHTGLWVEFAKAKESKGFQRFEALRAFNDLRDDYGHCTNRAETGDWQTLMEVLGASILFEMVDEGALSSDQQGDVDDMPNQALVRASQKLRERYKGSSIDALCRDAMPLATVHHACVRHVSDTVSMLKTQERRELRSERYRNHRKRGLTQEELNTILIRSN